MSDWYQKFHEWYAGPWPDSYLSWDMETSGLKLDYDLPVDIGHTLVRDGQVVHRGGFLLNWVNYPGIDSYWLEERLSNVAYHMEQQGKTYHYSVARMAEEGKDPYQVLKFYCDLFQKNRNVGGAFLGHGVWHFDSRMFANILYEVCGFKWEFDENELWDSGAIEKAVVGNIEPFPDEKTLKDYFLRVHYSRRPGLKWNIETCIERHNLAERFDLDLDELHGAEADSFVSHLLYQELKAIEEPL